MQNYMLFCEIYNNMSQEFYNNYIEANKEFDLLSHTDEQNFNYALTYQKKLRNAISTTIFQALAIESYINVFGVYKLGKKYNDHYERINTVSKLVVICRAITGKEFPEGKCLNGIKALMKKRDKLVHYKTKSIDLKNDDNNTYIRYMKENITFIFDDIDKQVQLYTELKEILKNLEGSPYDIFQQQFIDVNKEINIAVSEMYYGHLKEE